MVAAAGGNAKDIKIRFTGENLLGPVARSVQTELDNMVKRYQQAAKLTTAEVAKRAIAQRDAWMKPFMEFEKASVKGWVRFGSAAEQGFARAGKAAMNFGAAAKKAMGGLGLAAGMVGDLAGSDTTTGKAIGAVGNIAGQAALGGMVGGPWGAVAFGAIAAVKELKGLADVLKDVETNAAKAKAASAKSLLDRRKGVEDQVRNLRQSIFADRPISAESTRAEMELRLDQQRNLINSSRIDAGPGGRRVLSAQMQRMKAELVEFDRRAAQQQFMDRLPFGMGAVAASARLRAGNLSGLADRVGGVFSRTFGGALGGATEAFAMNRDMRLQTESPAEALRREFGNLAVQRQQGLTPENFARRSQQLRMAAIGQLPGMERTPNLAATEGRFITMGRRNEVKDELSALRRELKMHTEKQTTALVSAIRESGGTTDSL